MEKKLKEKGELAREKTCPRKNLSQKSDDRAPQKSYQSPNHPFFCFAKSFHYYYFLLHYFLMDLTMVAQF